MHTRDTYVYAFNFWRPAVGVPLAGTNGFKATAPDKSWAALGSPATDTVHPPTGDAQLPLVRPSRHAHPLARTCAALCNRVAVC